MRRSLLALAVLLIAAGCGDGRGRGVSGPAGAQRLAQQVLAWHGAADTVRVSLIVRVKQPGHETLSFSINAWTTADGRVRLNLAKLGFDGMNALIQPSGEFDILLRSNEAFHGWLYEFLPEHARVDRANLVLTADEVKRGPLAAVAAYEGEGRTLRYRDPATGFNAVVELAPGSLEVRRKVLTDDQGRQLAEFLYERYADVEGLHRPMKMQLKLPGGVDTTVRVETLDPVPSVSDERMRVKIPGDARHLSFDEFVDKLGG